jgi:L-alanine-DL-glutamate epimerase-like enolase superfamily enzyme
MRIARIDVFRIELPYSGGTYLLSGGREYRSFDATIVRITTDDGLEGWGESTPFGATYIAAHALGVRAGIAQIAPAVLGLDPRRVDRINDTMDAALVGHPHAKTPIDVACWDLFGKAVGMPACELLGGSTGVKLPLISSVHAGDPDDMRARVASYREQGYLGHSIKIGDDPVLDAARIEASLADERDDEFFLVDANGAMTTESALRMLRLLPAGLDFVLEAPCRTLRETLSLRRRASVPIVLDELVTDSASIAALIAEDAADGIGLKISKAGGLTPARRQRDLCLAAGLTLSVQDTTGSDLAFAAVVHVAQTVPERHLRCVLETRAMVTETTVENPIPLVDGRVMAPDIPGLGVTPRLDLLGEPVATYA